MSDNASLLCSALLSHSFSHTYLAALMNQRAHRLSRSLLSGFSLSKLFWPSSMYQALDEALHVMLNKGDSLCSWKSIIYSWRPHFTLSLLPYHTYALIKAIRDLTLYWQYLMLSLHQCVSSPPVKTYTRSPSSNPTCWSFLTLSPWPKAPSLC